MNTTNSEQKSSIPESWQELAEQIAASPGLAIVLGEIDTGKSTLCSFLAKHLCRKGLKVGLVDTDVGQSTLGPPMTIGGKICTSPEDVGRDLHPPILYFTGSPTPEGRLLDSLIGAAMVTGRVRREAPDAIVVDTTGLIAGDSGRRLKTHKVHLLRPAWIVGIQRLDELEHILSCFEREGGRVRDEQERLSMDAQSAPSQERRPVPFPAHDVRGQRRTRHSVSLPRPHVVAPVGATCGLAGRVVRLQASPEVKRRSREQRRKNRLAAYNEYFANAKLIDIEIGRVSIYDCPENLADALGPAFRGTTGAACAGETVNGMLVGLNNADGETLAVGRIEGADWARGIMSVSASAVEATAVRSLKFACPGAESALDDVEESPPSRSPLRRAEEGKK